MSNDNYKKLKAMWLANGRKAIEDSEKRLGFLQEGQQYVTLYVQSRNPAYITDNHIKTILTACFGKIVETIPFAEGGNQFKVEIRDAYSMALVREAGPVACVSGVPFARRTNPSKAFKPDGPAQ